MKEAFDPQLAARISRSGVVAVLVIDRAEDGPPVARALLEGGIAAMELTLRTPAAIDALKLIRAEVPDMLAGIGTIITTDQLESAISAGAAFGVAPGTNPRVLAAAKEMDFSFAPGILTPSDIETALEFGCKLLKFFPAEISGGLAYLKNISAPYAHLGLRYIPLGGLNSLNMASYLSDPLVAALGGSWIAPREVINRQDWAAIMGSAAQAAQLAAQARRLA
jgi:2-dehydro-3-deoxyphosphogluconate aldolase / (4S)-4-hydroxy-2-oxoglutarate aldolase